MLPHGHRVRFRIDCVDYRCLPVDMTPNPTTPLDSLADPSLKEVLGKTEHVKALVEQSASELTDINTALQRGAGQQDQPTTLNAALKKSQAVEEKVQDASGKLAAVTRELELEVGKRKELDLQLAEVTEQGLVSRHAALHDTLTGLANRSLFNDRLEHGLAQAKRHGLTLAVMFMDLDGFKAINDLHGHDAGDVLLKTVADRLKENTRDDDTVSRIGGDEFLYLVMGAGDKQAVAHLAEKIASHIQAPCQLTFGQVTIKISIGIARFPEDGDMAEELVKQADAAMYKAKRDQSEYGFAS